MQADPTPDLFTRTIGHSAERVIDTLAELNYRLRLNPHGLKTGEFRFRRLKDSSEMLAKTKLFSHDPSVDRVLRELIGTIQIGDQLSYTLHWPPKEISIDDRKEYKGVAIGYARPSGRNIALLLLVDGEVVPVRLNPRAYGPKLGKKILARKLEVDQETQTFRIMLKATPLLDQGQPPKTPRFFAKVTLKKL
ncbi:MAG: hypothetical protein R3A13_09150 [Bdellovibrionota bacterium]